MEEGEARAWAGEMGLEGYVETSAKEGTGVEEVRFSPSLALSWGLG